ncbi:AbrB family looped-hinge helix DNA binding protein [Amycolatopsis bartoniae]|uniref:AbrB family transcriptional regulator n=1 Tax=Amycolatopsis bartoniae TaxID=941986 RepID=A0A8H9IYV8_9PSEU|nr:AbrB/MazE/SpoVT family DNA-binding domain-containing protein [Amycolatopsis bartoniae]MBB2934012.1 AbrB family looped-hinge helix DNA binding protein [Amycolatopsis bartoniae]TVT00235.1 AbrB/MazE/SpoVT family DNA-binding domain-containing protein [Amycolatopsis bartoniae]GHF85909.1 AbrB family transcriptional regulator [Amycolatopsis bartoniae]
MRLTEKGQVTIPKAIRERLGLGPGDEVEFVLDEDGARIKRASGSPSRGRRLVERLRGRGDVALSTAEIMALTRDV